MTEFVLRNGMLVSDHGYSQADVWVQGSKFREIDTKLPSKKGLREIDCAGYYIYPGLINAHDHLEFNCYPRLGEPPYKNAYDWGRDLHKRWQSTIQSIEKIPLRHRLWWGAWKNLFSGVTRVVHHNPYSPLFRFGFPVDVLRRYTFAHSLEFESDLQKALDRRKRNVPFILHLAEGVDEVSFREVQGLNELGGIDERTVAVHAVGISKRDVEIFRDKRASVIWCPSSNLYLFNKTAPIDELVARIPICVGTDSTLTGGETLFNELRTAQQESSLTPQQLFNLATIAPSRVFHLNSDAGTIIEGGKADLFLLRMDGSDPYDRLLRASPLDVVLLVRNGVILFYDSMLKQKKDSTDDGFKLQINGQTKVIRDRLFPKIFPELRQYLSHYSYLKSHAKRAPTTRIPTQEISFCCPSCKKPLAKSKGQWKCVRESYIFESVNGIPEFILPSRRACVNEFLNVYQQIRRHEHWGSDDIRYYLDLPHRDITGQHSKIWNIRARTFDCLMNDEGFRQSSSKTSVLDVGAGNCWLSIKLAQHGFQVVAVDINTNPVDGLGVYSRMQNEGGPTFQRIRAEFDSLPFAGQCFDHIVFNASLHYSKNPNATLLSALSFLKNTGTLWILDSPIYHDPKSGEAMVKERSREFKNNFNLSVAREFEGSYLIFSELEKLRTSYKIEYRIPDYGFLWNLRPVLSSLLRRREPASFMVVKIQKLEETV